MATARASHPMWCQSPMGLKLTVCSLLEKASADRVRSEMCELSENH